MKLLIDLALVTACLTTASAVECYRPDPQNFCVCTILPSVSKTNITINLQHIGLRYPYQVDGGEDNKYTYQYTPCKPVTCPNTGEPSATCQYVKNQMYWTSLGRFQNFGWDIIQDNPANLSFRLNYEGGDDGRKSIIDFITGTSDTTFVFTKENANTKAYRFTVKGKGVAPYKPSSSSSSGGDISGPIGIAIIGLALGGFVAYFVIGGIFMYTKKGARGTEVIPNIAFWKEFPFLIKDGMLFTISPCYKRDKYQGL